MGELDDIMRVRTYISLKQSSSFINKQIYIFIYLNTISDFYF